MDHEKQIRGIKDSSFCNSAIHSILKMVTEPEPVELTVLPTVVRIYAYCSFGFKWQEKCEVF